jgi:hypothetical protein
VPSLIQLSVADNVVQGIYGVDVQDWPIQAEVLHHTMADDMEVSDKESELPEVPSVVEDATVAKYFKECIGVTAPPDTTLKELMDNSIEFPRYFHLQNMMNMARTGRT